ncbi:MAG: MBL fold metallo-hydrolase [Bacteroidota bacterium]|nr:MBL fold metallo-hydrolase [Bacteroidota bacterium]
MSLYITSLNSGSNGNCYYVGNGRESVLIDAGISCRETEKRMNRLGLDMAQVKAIFVSHEHGDHITGIPALSKKFRLPVYITEATYSNSNIPIEPDLIRHFQPHETIGIGNITVTAFPKFHDAAEPHSFLVSSREVNVGIFTDLGFACEQLIHHFKQCHAAFLEANYDVNMLEKGNYPYHLKKRISGGQGHLSNEQALQLFLQHRPAHMSHLVLAHLSKNNNHPKLVEDLFQQHAGNTRIVVASRYQETEVYHIQAHATAQVIQRPKPPTPAQVQLSLF